MSRISDLVDFYGLLGELEGHVGGTRMLSNCDGSMPWPQRGVYFFFEPGEVRSDSGQGPRIVRVGTHALTGGSKATLWNRLRQHKGSARSGGGNNRGSVFRKIVGSALIKRDGQECPSWGEGSTAPRDVRRGEHTVEQSVSEVIGAMPFLWLAINDEPGTGSLRGYVERNAIALLSNHDKDQLDRHSERWLGCDCNRPLVRSSGIWNQNHVEEQYDRGFLMTLERYVREAGSA